MQRYRQTVASKLQDGEIVVTHGLLCLMQNTQRRRYSADEIVTFSRATVLNTEESVTEDAPMSWGWLFENNETAPHWTVKSNDLSTWAVLVYGPELPA
jgi:hypothetical protein